MTNSTPSGLLIDIDGTLLGRNEEVSPRLFEAISAAKKLVPVALASGRGVEDVKTVACSVGLDGLHIGDNGAALVDAATGNTECDVALPEDLARQIIEAADSAGVHYFASQNGRNLYSKHELVSWRVNLITIRLNRLDEAGDWGRRFECEKIAWLPSVASSGRPYINFTNAGIDKGRGARELATVLGIDLARVVAVGDGYNDVPMFEAVGFPVAMGHAPEEVKSRAVAVVGSIDSDGAAEAIERYVLNGSAQTPR